MKKWIAKWVSVWLALWVVLLLASFSPLARAGQIASLSLINQTSGERLQIWRHDGRNYVAGNPGDRYAIEVKNKTNGRVLSVVSVDGVNVVSGTTASVGQSGYVLDVWQPLEIKGWRKNMNEVAAFYFTHLADSYAARTGRPNNVGVIGVALFPEYVEPIAMREEVENRFAGAASAAPSSADAAEAPAKAQASSELAKRSRADSPIGTGHGERVTSASRNTEFRRASESPSELISIYYDTYEHLVARGIIPGTRYRHVEPRAFPGGSAPDPS